MEGLNAEVLQKIFAMPEMPKDIAGWYKQAAKLDSQYRRFQEIHGQRKGAPATSNKAKFTPRYTAPRTTNPNAMDID